MNHFKVRYQFTETLGIFSVIDKHSEHLVARCYSSENASMICDALNFSSAPKNARESLRYIVVESVEPERFHVRDTQLNRITAGVNTKSRADEIAREMNLGNTFATKPGDEVTPLSQVHALAKQLAETMAFDETALHILVDTLISQSEQRDETQGQILATLQAIHARMLDSEKRPR